MEAPTIPKRAYHYTTRAKWNWKIGKEGLVPQSKAVIEFFPKKYMILKDMLKKKKEVINN